MNDIMLRIRMVTDTAREMWTSAAPRTRSLVVLGVFVILVIAYEAFA